MGGTASSNKLSTPRPANRNGGPVHAVWSASGGDTREASGYAQRRMTKQEARAMSIRGWTNGIAPSARDEGTRTPTKEPVREQPWDATNNAGELFVDVPPPLTSNATWVPENQYGHTIADPVGEVGRHIYEKPSIVQAAIETGAIHNATWVPPNQYGRVCPDPMGEVGQHITGRRASVTQLAEDGKMTNASWVPPNRFGRTIPDPKKEVGRFIEDRATNVPRQLASGEASNAQWVPRGKYGNSIHDPKAEVGQYIDGLNQRVNRDIASGDWSNSSWVPPNQYGRNIPDPNAEVGAHIKDRRSSVHADWRSGKHKNASWVPKNKFGRTIPDPMKEVGEHIKGRRKSVGDDLPQGRLNNATWIAPNMYGRTIQDPMAEVGEHIDGRREKVHADIKSGDLSNSTWVEVRKESSTAHIDKNKARMERQSYLDLLEQTTVAPPISLVKRGVKHQPRVQAAKVERDVTMTQLMELHEQARVLEEMANQQMPRASSDSNTSSLANETQASPVVTPNSAIARNAPRNVPASTYKYNRLGEAEIVTAASQVADVAPSPIVWLKTDEGDTFDPTVLLSVRTTTPWGWASRTDGSSDDGSDAENDGIIDPRSSTGTPCGFDLRSGTPYGFDQRSETPYGFDPGTRGTTTPPPPPGRSGLDRAGFQRNNSVLNTQDASILESALARADDLVDVSEDSDSDGSVASLEADVNDVWTSRPTDGRTPELQKSGMAMARPTLEARRSLAPIGL